MLTPFPRSLTQQFDGKAFHLIRKGLYRRAEIVRERFAPHKFQAKAAYPASYRILRRRSGKTLETLPIR